MMQRPLQNALLANLFLSAVAAAANTTTVNEDVIVSRVADLAPGNQSSSMRDFVMVQDHVYFVASPDPTTMADYNADNDFNSDNYAESIFSIDSQDRLHTVLDGTTADSVLAQGLFALNDHLVLMTGEDEEHGRELWVLDSNKENNDNEKATVRLVKDINPGPSSCFLPFDAYPVFTGGRGNAYFVARTLDDNVNPDAHQLYRSDGTANGTQPVTDLDVSVQNLEFSRHVVDGLDRVFYFLVNRKQQDDWSSEVWISSSSASARESFTMYTLDEALSNTFAITVLPESINGKIALVYAEAWRAGEACLWTIDPESGAQTQLICGLVNPLFLSSSAQIGSSSSSGNDDNIRMIQVVSNSTDGAEDPTALVVTDGTVTGTSRFREFDPQNEGYTTGLLSLSDDKVIVFQQRIVAEGTDDPLATTATETTTASSRNDNASNTNMMEFPPPTVMDLWITDGTAAGTFLFMTMPDDTMVFKGHPISNGRVVLLVTQMSQAQQQKPTTYELWVTDGTMDGTSTVYASPLFYTPTPEDEYFLVLFGLQKFTTAGSQDRLIFTGYDVEHGVEPWVMHFDPPDNNEKVVEADGLAESDGPAPLSSSGAAVMMTVATTTCLFSSVLFTVMLQPSTF